MSNHHPRPTDFRYRSANSYAVQSLDSLQMRGVISSWYYEPADKVFGVHTHGHGGPLMLTGAQVATFEAGAIAAINAVVVNGLTVAEMHAGVATQKTEV